MANDDVVRVYGPLIPIQITGPRRVVNISKRGGDAALVNGESSMKSESSDRVTVINKANAEYDAAQTLQKLAAREAFVKDQLGQAGHSRQLSDDESRLVAHAESPDRVAVINKLGAEYDGSRELQAVCSDRATYINGTIIGKGIAPLSADERRNFGIMQGRRL